MKDFRELKRRLIEIHWTLPLQDRFIRHIFKVFVLIVGGTFGISTIPPLIEPLPELSELSELNGRIVEVKYLGKSRRGFRTKLTVALEQEKFIFKNMYSRATREWLANRLEKPVHILWRDEFEFIRLSRMPRILSLSVDGESLTNFEREYMFRVRAKHIYKRFWFYAGLFLIYFFGSNYYKYRRR